MLQGTTKQGKMPAPARSKAGGDADAGPARLQLYQSPLRGGEWTWPKLPQWKAAQVV